MVSLTLAFERVGSKPQTKIIAELDHTTNTTSHFFGLHLTHQHSYFYMRSKFAIAIVRIQIEVRKELRLKPAKDSCCPESVLFLH